MNITPLHHNFQMPVKATAGAGAIDLFMPEDGAVHSNEPEGVFVGLGFKAAVPEGYVAMLLPRSGAGAKKGLSLNNTVGIIDSDYRGEWMACIRNRNHAPITWKAGDRLFQAVIVPALNVDLVLTEDLDETERGTGGFGSTSR